jgi:DNA-binding LacI/PurR family transcriptional regulator
VEEAMRLLERDGLIRSQGAGKRRKVEKQVPIRTSKLRIGMLLSDEDDMKTHYISDLRHQLERAGHEVVVAERNMTDLHLKVERVARLVGQTPADGWVVVAGSREILEWFSRQAFPTMALFGVLSNLPLAYAAPVKVPVLRELIQRLVKLGHRRITLLAAERLRKPRPGSLVQTFMDELQANGIPTGPFNLPDWLEDGAGLSRCLENLFKTTPPTALIADDGLYVPAILQFLAKRKLSAPNDVSLVCLDEVRAFRFMNPTISHFTLDSRPWIRRAVNWANNVAAGVQDCGKALNKAKFIEGGTIGPAKG